MRLAKPYAYAAIFRSLINAIDRSRYVLTLRPRQRAMICSQLFDEAHTEATGRILVQRADTDVVPAELSATDDLADVQPSWRLL